jgi:hypothetical protein
LSASQYLTESRHRSCKPSFLRRRCKRWAFQEPQLLQMWSVDSCWFLEACNASSEKHAHRLCAKSSASAALPKKRKARR